MQEEYQSLIKHLQAYNPGDFGKKEVEYIYEVFQLLKSVFNNPVATRELLADNQTLSSINDFSYLLECWEETDVKFSESLGFQKLITELLKIEDMDNHFSKLCDKLEFIFSHSKKEQKEKIETANLSIDPALTVTTVSAPPSTSSISSSTSLESLSSSVNSSTTSSQSSSDSLEFSKMTFINKITEENNATDELMRNIEIELRDARAFQYRAGLASSAGKFFFENYFIKQSLSHYEKAFALNKELSESDRTNKRNVACDMKNISYVVSLLKSYQAILEQKLKESMTLTRKKPRKKLLFTKSMPHPTKVTDFQPDEGKANSKLSGSKTS